MPYINAVGRTLVESSPSTRWVTADQPGQTLTGTALNETLTGSSGHTLVGGNGDDIYGLAGPAAIVESAGGGIDTMSAWTSATLPAHVENLVMNGGYGWFAIGNELDNIIRGTGGRQQIDGRAGNDVLSGGDGADLFIVHRGNGSDLIVDFGRGADQLRLSGYGLHSFGDVLAIASQNGSNVVLDLVGGEILVLQNFLVSDLEARDFLLEVDLSRYTRTFSEEFDSLSLSITGGLWDTFYSHNDSADLRSRFHAGEDQIYVDPMFAGTSGQALGLNPFSIADGILTITAAPAPSASLPYLGNQTYTSGLLTTESSFAQQYGYFEVRAALPEGQGFWPAFWLLPEDGSWPPEIDVFEMLGRDPDSFYYSTHTVLDGRHVVETGQYHVDTTQFHVYGVDWGPQTITFYLDGAAIGQVPTPASMHQPFYMLVNLAVGGAWGGSPDETTGTGLMQVDYVRAWRTADTVVDATDGADVMAVLAPGGNVSAGAGNDHVTGSLFSDFIHGNAGDDTLSGSGGADTVLGGRGNDVVEGNEGDDIVYGDLGDDTVRGGGGNDLVQGNGGNDLVHGNIGNDVVRGGQGDDQLFGGAGNDFLGGDLGNDTLSGGAGPDVFHFSSSGGRDVVMDFNPAEGDRVLLDAAGPYTVVQIGNDTVITLQSGAQMFLHGVPLPSLSDGWLGIY